jgi:hypothetical protein
MGHLRFVHPRRDRVDANAGTLQSELSSHHLRKMGRCGLGTIVRKLEETYCQVEIIT